MSGPEDEIEVLLPEQYVTICDEQIEVKEYSFLQGMQVDAIAQPLLGRMAALFEGAMDVGEGFPYMDLAAAFGSHPHLLTRLLSISTGKPEAWVESLDDEQGQLLLMAWWRANRHFFVRRLVGPVLARRATGSAGAKSSPA